MDSVQTTMRSPKDFVDSNKHFSIPSYQRPYVWSDAAVTTLFNDLKSAFEHKMPHYFVGTLLTAENVTGVLELIDGQQRTTSLLLLALACKKKNISTDLTQLICTKTTDGKEALRLRFKIRDQVEAYLGHMVGLVDYENHYPSDEEVQNNPYLSRLAGALATFENLLDQLSVKEQSVFADYVYSSMSMVENRIPPSTDLNKLFATMNNSGVQLEQSDILKSLLLKKITKNKARYNAIWQVCEMMDNYFERNVRKVFPQTDWSALTVSDFAVFGATIFRFTAEEEYTNVQGNSIAQLAEMTHQQGSENSDDKLEHENDVYCESIISFPQLLLHTYRIYLKQNQRDDFTPRFHSDQLISIFKPLLDEDEEQIKAFLQLLWQVRFAFDFWVVKWVEKADEDEQQLTLCAINGPSKSSENYYFNRSSLEHSSLSMLQMVRHFTADRNAQYWLTAFLGWLVQRKPIDREIVLKRLERIDNHLSLADIEQKAASYILIKRSVLPRSQRHKGYFLADYLAEKKGVRFKHYWFQKLEYLLWKHQEDYLPTIDAEKFKRYRIISRNSVEHVHPQNEEYGKELKEGYLDCFGNLALLNVSQNSAYSNQSVGKKCEDFNAKPVYDSLKLACIFALMKGDAGEWDETKIAQHQNDMVELLLLHYGCLRQIDVSGL